MADGGPPQAKATAFWGSILLAARVHATTAEVWQAIREASASSGVALPGDMFAQVNRMRSLATTLRNSGEAIAGAAGSDALTSSMIGTQLYARSALERSLSPAYHVRFELSTTTDAGSSTGWYTLEYSGSLPATVGELQQQVLDYANGLADSYGSAVGDLGTLEIGAF
jgi:hypothetical protein